MAEHQLLCPQCHDGTQLHVLEIERYSRAIPDVTTNHTEYGDQSSEPRLQEIGVQCHNCGWERMTPGWKRLLEKGPKLDDEPADPA